MMPLNCCWLGGGVMTPPYERDGCETDLPQDDPLLPPSIPNNNQNAPDDPIGSIFLFCPTACCTLWLSAVGADVGIGPDGVGR